MLMPPTPPSAHVEFSKNQIVVLLSVMGASNVVGDVPLFAGRGPVLNPLSVTLWSCAGTHGASNVDWIRSYVPFVTAGRREVSFRARDIRFVCPKIPPRGEMDLLLGGAVGHGAGIRAIWRGRSASC